MNRRGLPEAPELVGSVGQSVMAESCPSELREPAARIVVEHEKHHDSQTFFSLSEVKPGRPVPLRRAECPPFEKLPGDRRLPDPGGGTGLGRGRRVLGPRFWTGCRRPGSSSWTASASFSSPKSNAVICLR